jgi:hypothetical protein
MKVLEDLHAVRGGERIVPATNTRRTLGAGTEYAKGQSWCFTVNMSHPDVTGAVDLKLVAGGGGGEQGRPPGLHVVQ